MLVTCRVRERHGICLFLLIRCIDGLLSLGFLGRGLACSKFGLVAKSVVILPFLVVLFCLLHGSLFTVVVVVIRSMLV